MFRFVQQPPLARNALTGQLRNVVSDVETQISALAAQAICICASLMVAIYISEDIMEYGLYGQNKWDVSSRLMKTTERSFPRG
jgi:hypothetical protein